ncbi:MAG TPA: protein kinase, partial [Candidatus Polarisedimenticolia bacterium]|nr:protein kinase [Candidatus Polarisedimenticolia bacterium]
MRAAGSSSGRRRVSHYEILAELGRGGMGVVYRARDLDLGREVALKCSLQEKAASAGARRRFLREARAAAALTHANIVPVFEVFEAEGQLWLAMELVAGRSLRELLDSQGALPLPEFLGCAEGLAGALAEAQRHRILHRDITPRNILIGADGRPRLTDFGLARHFVPQGEESMAPTTAGGPVTRRGAIVGTPGYMAPEQVLGRPLDTRCDIFSLGAVLYEMCTGRPAFPQRESGRLIDAILHEEPVPMSRPGISVPAELEQIIRKCLRKPPDERYQHAADLLADLKTLRRYTGSGERPSPAPARTRGRPAAAVMSIGGTLLAAALFYGLHWLQSAGPPVEPGGGPILESLVTWPGEDHGSRISPDGQWVSFLSSTDGQQSVWVVRVSGGDPRPLLAEQGRITSHAWSPDGERMALTVLLDGALYLRIL